MVGWRYVFLLNKILFPNPFYNLSLFSPCCLSYYERYPLVLMTDFNTLIKQTEKKASESSISMARTSQGSNIEWRSAISIAILAFSVKLSLIPAPHSTDLEVHRHWKALTLNLPISQWYADMSSIWTLDYPPLFAYFEYALARILGWIHAPLVQIENHNYCEWPVVPLLRLSVLALDPLFVFAVVTLTSCLYSNRSNRLVSTAFVVLNPALIIVDNIHFQYNVLPISFLLLTLSALRYDWIAVAAGLFTMAVNMKHTFVPLGLPLVCHVLGILRLRVGKRTGKAGSLRTLLNAALVTLFVLFIIWFPFIRIRRRDIFVQIANRLFPFHRGLFHANWAPNVWAVYAIVDKILVHLGFVRRIPDGSITTGVIGAIRPFSVLPNPTPLTCMMFQILVSIPALFRSFNRPNVHTLVHTVVVCAVASCLFGWHVHEKSLLVGLLPLAALSCRSQEFAMSFVLLSAATHLAVLDLVVHHDMSSVFARCFTMAFHCIVLAVLLPSFSKPWYRFAVLLFCGGCLVVDVYARLGFHVWLFGEALAFLPHIIAALFGSLGVAMSFLILNFGLFVR